ncbi:MAG: fibrobacter succinogenes major paralogous domain-containing protein [Fibrobacteraceae bacterium]|nr:fibrobacter succinogenes major paralogous domain-containing protein [Fibrobacteraceae bacterium]
MKLKTKLGILLISISSVMLYVGCSSSDSSTSAPEDLVANTLADLPNCTEKREGKTAVLLEDNSTYLCTEGKWTFVSAAINVVESLDDLLNCTSKIEGDSSYVSNENTVYLCISESWRELGEFGTVSDSLPNCTEKREGERVFLSEEHVTLICNANKWKRYDIFSAVEEEENSKPKSSSSENEWEDYEPVSSSSVKVSSSSTKVSSSSESDEKETFTDSRDGQTYKYVKIGDQVWMAENLNYETANSYCYNDSTANCKKYGRLYTWETALNVCPSGWHLPTDEEFETLRSNVGGSDVAGKMLKSTTGWYDYGNGVDKYGFNVLPAGFRDFNGIFYLAGKSADFWSATEDGESSAYRLRSDYDVETARLDYLNKAYATSVRCLRD